MKWFEVRARGSAPRSAEVLIYGDIGRSWDGTTVEAEKFVESFSAIDADEISVRINSFGGSVTDGLAIFAAITRHPAEITVHVDGVAASIASLIAQAGDRVLMAKSALMMVHAPWGGVVGNAHDLREMADTMDAHARAMAAAYARGGMSASAALELLSDRRDHWFTAAEAVDAGLADDITEPLEISASLRRSVAARFPTFNAAARRIALEDIMHEDEINPISGGSRSQRRAAAAADSQAVNALAVAAEVERERRTEVGRIFEWHGGRPAMFSEREGYAELHAACVADPTCSEDAARERLLAFLGKDVKPIGRGYVYTLNDETDKQRAGMRTAIEIRAGLTQDDSKNPYRGLSLPEMARASLMRAGVRDAGRLGRSEVVGLAFTHTSSDFPKILEGVASKGLLKGWTESPETFHLWTAKGSLSDFKPAKRVGLNVFPTIAQVPEGAEFHYSTIGERGESIFLLTYGRLFGITRQAIINDDLALFSRLPESMGRAARRLVGDMVYGVLTGNVQMSDGQPLFDPSHENDLTAANINTDSVGAMRTAMALQRDPDNLASALGIRLKRLLVPVGLEGRANTVRASEYHIGPTEMSNTAPNAVKDTFEVISEPRLDIADANGWYGVADAAVHDVIEVAYLDGVDTPFLDRKEGWNVDGVELKVRLDVGVKALDFRTIARNVGA